MKFQSALVLLAGSVSSGVAGGRADLVSSATTDIASSMTRGVGGTSGARLRASSPVVAGAAYTLPHEQHSVGVASAVIGRADNMYMANSHMVMVQGEQFKREMRRQTNDQLSRILLQTSDITYSGAGEADEQEEDEEMVVLYMGGLKEISDRVRRFLFGNREESSSAGEAGASGVSGAGGLRNWFQDRQ
jgi:hypothetical protein